MRRRDIRPQVVVLACWAFHAGVRRGGPRAERSIDVLIGLTGAPFKVAYRAMERDEAAGLIGYGNSLETAWPTAEGFLLANPPAAEASENNRDSLGDHSARTRR